MADYPDDLRREDAKRAHDAEGEFGKQNNEAAINSGAVAIRTAFLINGGAAVAMLTFIGSMVAQGRIGDTDLHGLASNLMWFASGVALAAAASTSAYFVNLATAGMSVSRKRTWDHPYLGTPDLRWVITRWVSLTFAVLAVSGSLFTFAWGMHKVASVVERIKVVHISTPAGSNAVQHPNRGL